MEVYCKQYAFTHIFKVRNTDTQLPTQISRELVKWWNASSFYGSPNLSSLSQSLSFRWLSPCSHFCNLPQLIESQWCENMALWQRACQSARSLILFFSLFIILEIYMKIDWIKTEQKSLPVALWRSLICITLLMLLGNLPVSVVACWIEVKEAKAQTQEFLSLLIQM